MRKIGLFYVLFTILSCSERGIDTGNPLPPEDQVPGYVQRDSDEYIVVFKDWSSFSSENLFEEGEVIREYENLNGYHVKMDSYRVSEIMDQYGVDYIEPNQIFHINTQQTGATWGIDRIDARKGLDSTYNYNSTGAGVTAYIVDTGMNYSHTEFTGRTIPGYSAIDNSYEDCNGHGTHVAGTIAGKTYGIAKGAKVASVRVLDCQGSGSTSQIVNGLNWLISNAKKPAVANMSLGGSKSQALDDGVRRAIASGIVFSLAAGNESQDACNVSPANVPEAITVAASDKNDAKASFSNYGSCVDIFAPGVGITSAKMGGGSTSMSGTSMAAPHVAGVAALFLQRKSSVSPNEIWNYMKGLGTPNVISGASGAPNLLLYSDPNNGGGNPTDPTEPTPPTPPKPGEPSFCNGNCSHYLGKLGKNGADTIPSDKPFFINNKTIRAQLVGTSGVQVILWKTTNPYYKDWELVTIGSGNIEIKAGAAFYAWVVFSGGNSGNYELWYAVN
jgi:subtilisin family serine protease